MDVLTLVKNKMTSLLQVKYVTDQRAINGVVRHLNVSVKEGESTYNFNVEESDSEEFQATLDWAASSNVEIIKSSKCCEKKPFQWHGGKRQLSSDASLWRYMGLAKFLSLISSNGIWLSRLDQNWALDPLEGKVPRLSLIDEEDQILNTSWAPQYTGKGKHQFGGQPEPGMTEIPRDLIIKSQIEMSKQLAEVSVYNSYVSCWNQDEHESYGMWKAYCDSDNSVAVRTSVGRLIDSMGKNKDFTISGGMIQYLDHESERPASSGFFNSHVFCKSYPYKFENEFRLCFTDLGFVSELMDSEQPYARDGQLIKSNIERYPIGVNLPLDLSFLIEEVRVSPYAAPWLQDTLVDLMKKFNTSENQLKGKPVLPSTMK
ncbi:hypothetical protein [Alteromonas antoniana]|uniref:hypothetical protein n=1 Tax=Alteromonas antoniana TaxID=2803813 RepID=UPI001C454CBA|nr:hypothetical protein [Alteromonas antoniana]